MLWNVISDSLGRTFILQNRLLKKTGFPSFNYVLFTIFQVLRGAESGRLASIRKLILSLLTVPPALPLSRSYFEGGVFLAL